VPRESILLLLDRDGTLMVDVGYPKNPADVRLLPGARAAIAKLRENGFVPAIVSNQSGVGRGWITPTEAAAVHEEFLRQMGREIPSFFCFHEPSEGCACRKPATGLLEEAARVLGLVNARRVMIGDRSSDLEAGRRLNATTVSLGPAGAMTDGKLHDFASDSWPEIVTWLLTWRDSLDRS
jgi:D-glycero-D-manno-heptose 1,7-bisphosphate phosphatase